MPLPAVTNEVPDGLKDHYVPLDNGTFQLDVTLPNDNWEFGDISGLKSALGKTKSDLTQAKNALKAFGDYSAEDVQTSMNELAKLRDQAGKAPDADTIRAQIAQELGQQHAAQMKEWETKYTAQQKQLHDVTVKSTAMKAIQDAGGNVDLLLPHVLGNARMDVGEDNRVATVVHDAEGNPRFNGQGQPMTVNELVEGMKANTSFAAAFAGSGATGSGSAAANTSGVTTGVGGVLRIPASDQAAVQANLELIQTGKAEIV